jgi:DNA-binding phage protein
MNALGNGDLTMSQTLTTFDMTALLDSDKAISEYLSQVLADGDNEEFLRAVGYVVEARDDDDQTRGPIKPSG